MNYLPRNRIRRSYTKPILITLGIFFIGWMFFSFLNGAVVAVISPLWQAENSFSQVFKKGLEHWQSRTELVSENLFLKKRVASLELEVDSLGLSLEQERAFYGLLGRSQVVGEVVASVITRPPQSPYDIIFVDAGSSDGVAVGFRVNLPEGPALGLVTEVFASNARVELFSTAGKKRDAVLERGSVPVVLEGRGGGNFRLRIPREVEVEVGDRIVTGDALYSLLAVVESVSVFSTDSFKEVLARSPLNIFSLRLVSITP